MPTMAETTEAVSTVEPSHDYHAEAHVLSGELERPVEQKIEQHAPVALKDRRGGHLTRFAEAVSIEGLVAFSKGHTRVSGSRSKKHDGWITIATSVVEGLNVFEIITADRIVSQVSTDHAYKDGHVPRVTFLGTQFRGLRVSGFKVKLTLNLGICGADRPANSRSYLRDPKFLNAVKTQTETITTATGLPKEFKEQYDKNLAHTERLLKVCEANDQNSRAPVTCSLVQSIDPIPIAGVQTFGHIILIPEFGVVTLGEVEVGDTAVKPADKPIPYFELTGIRVKLGCVGHGTASAAMAKANGQTAP
jgi:hypothetical protein